MERKQFTFYRSYLDAIVRLPKKEQGAILLAICQYALNESEPAGLSPIAETVFTLVRPTLDAGRRKSQAGETGGKFEAKRKQETSKTEAKAKQTESKKEGEIEKEVEVEIEIENKCYKEKTPDGVEKKQRFVPPTVEQVAAYCRERGNGVDPQRWHDHYSAKGWVIGKSPMKDWKSAVRTWERGNEDGSRGKPAATEPKHGTVL